MTPTLVVFDLYGTLICLGVRRHPFRTVLQWARAEGRQPQADDARRLMTTNYDGETLLAELGIYLPPQRLGQLHRDLQVELDSLTLYDDVVPTLNALLRQGVELAICSNLAKPYGAVIDRLLSEFSFARHLSYALGAIKPEKAIYDAILSTHHINPAQILFVGDTLLADYEGPVKYGFQARHLVRDHPRTDSQITELTDVLPLCRIDCTSSSKPKKY